jgi:hypothetical protein
LLLLLLLSSSSQGLNLGPHASYAGAPTLEPLHQPFLFCGVFVLFFGGGSNIMMEITWLQKEGDLEGKGGP